MIVLMNLLHARVQFDHSISPRRAASILSVYQSEAMDNRTMPVASDVMEKGALPETWAVPFSAATGLASAEVGMSKSALHRLLDDNTRFDLGGRGTVNHLPMALYALSQMGASDERLAEYFRWWEENRALPRRETGRRVGADEWDQYIGEPSMFGALWEIFARRASDRGSAEVVSEVFPFVSDGIAAAAFHGLIRLAYGIEAEHMGEIGAGLATLCSRYANLDLPHHPPATSSVEDALARIANELGGAVFSGQGIIGQISAAAADPRFADAF
jgi:hypothetical protein